MMEKILLVDDEEGIRKVLGIYLMDDGYEVSTAESGEEALEIFRKIQPPIVLTDIKMPGMDGIELLQKIKAENSDTEVIMITGHGDIDLTIKSLQYDAADFITKPINDEALEVALKRARERISMKMKLKAYTEDLERLVQEKTRQLVQSEKLAAVGETVAGLSHAIKNIAGGLKGGIFVLEKGIHLDNKTYLINGWEMVQRNVDKISKLTLDMLNYAGERELQCRACNPNGLLEDIYNLMESRAKELGIDLKTDLDENLHDICFDPDALHTCLLNLVTNAMDACMIIESSDRSGEVILQSKKIDGWGVEYQIVDNGCGMDKETVDKIFQRFFSTKGTKGTGLGLMISKKVIDDHKGNIHVVSKEGKGSRFIIRLPDKDQVQDKNNFDESKPV
ncbi:MAG: response regulator [Deltaproteobacteria bacterium]|nr:response regulator [Deltaproteobacteria bacterium]